MSNNEITHNSKSIFARLLATEDLNVVHSYSANTAAFDLTSRTLILPVWKKMSHHLYDMLIAHEVGHAVYTPGGTNKDWENKSKEICPENPMIGQLYLNIVEDARIERLIQKKYPGAKRDFWFGYQELLESDMFGLEGKDPKDLQFIDRLNLHFKVGSFVNLGEFSVDEQKFIHRVETAETWEEVVQIAKDLYCHTQLEFMKEMELEMDMDSDEEDDGDSDTADGQTSPMSEGSGDSSGEQSSQESSGEQPSTEAVEGTGTISANAVPSKTVKTETVYTPVTQQSMEQNIHKSLVEKGKDKESHKPVVISEPKLNLAIVSTKDILRGIDIYVEFDYLPKCNDYAKKEYTVQLAKAQTMLADFRTQAKPSVDTLCKQFEMKKAADIHKRTSRRTTGVLNMDRLHAYKVTDNLFLQRTNVKEGKNHGLIMFVDWSGSMADILADTLRQMIILMDFCRRCDIPYEIYSFVSGNYNTSKSLHASGVDFIRDMWNDPKNTEHFTAVCPSMFSLLHLFSSSNTKAEEAKMLNHIFAYALSFERNSQGMPVLNLSYAYPSWMQMNATPLNECLLCIPQIYKNFVNKFNRDINHMVILTDGEASGYIIPSAASLVDPKTKARYSCKSGDGLYMNQRMTQGLVQWVKDRTGGHVVCIELTNSPGYIHNAFNVEGIHPNADTNKNAQSQWSKESYVEVPTTNHAYDSFFVVKARNAVCFDEFDNIDTSNLTPSKIKNTFIKYQKKKVMSRYMINRFVEMIAA